ncbi:hypothetical protein IHE44_0014704 [Lamprotornis superbus]|uniref:Uncharacterized protein n=1 Tax=Lamprotornis superbus TaxID=245042 RepID=A0A835TTR9_9PASS|nr:hypothetical protein IHE44_0014704 [Lamprotornis superbus]
MRHTKEISDRRARFPNHEGGAAGETGHSPDRRYAMVLFRITSPQQARLGQRAMEYLISHNLQGWFLTSKVTGFDLSNYYLKRKVLVQKILKFQCSPTDLAKGLAIGCQCWRHRDSVDRAADGSSAIYSSSRATQNLSYFKEKLSIEKELILQSLHDSAQESVIKRDIHRTYPAHDYFKDTEGDGQESLYKICKEM